MIRRIISGAIAFCVLAGGGWAWLQRRNRRLPGEPNTVQWPFDTSELRTLMDRVVTDQRERIMAIEDIAGRRRAEAFLNYYERRRTAITT